MSENKLAAAAEALVQAAVSETSSSIFAINREVADGIQSISADLKGRGSKDSETLNSIQAKVDTLNSNVDTLNSNMVMMQATMCSIDTSLKTQERLKRIEFALDQCSHGVFLYSTNEVCDRSDVLVKSILLNFRKGLGHYIALETTRTGDDYGLPSNLSYKDKLALNQKFRDALTEQLYTILGVKPVWSEPEKNGGRMIIYP
jgi:hypothetical protein